MTDFNPFMMIDCYEFTQGNPGCCTIFQYVWDLGDLSCNQLKLWCRTKNVYGSDVWVQFKELSNKDYPLFFKIVKQQLKDDPKTAWSVEDHT